MTEENQYTVEVRYTITNKYGTTVSATQTYRTRAKNKQYVKYQYHKHTHENYKTVDRTLEDVHVHPVNDRTLEHSIESISQGAPESGRWGDTELLIYV